MYEDETTSIRICQDGHANALAMNRDCTQIAVGGRSLLKIFTIEGFTEVCNLRGGKNQNLSYSSNDVAWSHLDVNLLATAATNGVVSIWDISRFGRQKQTLLFNDHERTAHSVAFHNNDPNLLISASQDGSIKCFDMRTEKGAIHTYVSNSESIRDVKFSPHSSNTFAGVGESGTVQVWDVRRPDKCLHSFTAHSGPIYTLDWHPTQNWLATGSRDKQIKVWTVGVKPQLEHCISTIAVVGRVKWRPNRMYQLASCALVLDYSIHIWDVRRAFLPYASFTQHTNITTDIEFKSNDPNVLLSTSKDSTIVKHNFKSAQMPFLKANPQCTSLSIKGEVLFADRPIRKNSLTSPKAFDELFQYKDSKLQCYHWKDTMNNLLDSEVDLLDASNEDIFDSLAKSVKLNKNSTLWRLIMKIFEMNTKSTSPIPSVNSPTTKTNQQMHHHKESKSSLKDLRDPSEINKEKLSLMPSAPRNFQDDSNLTDIIRTGKDFTNENYVFSNQEINFEHLSCIKTFRHGFLYFGPHDLMRDNILLSSETTTLAPTEDHHVRELRPDPPQLIKVVDNGGFLAPSWEPYTVLKRLLLQLIDIGNIQVLVPLLLTLGEKSCRSLLDEQTQESLFIGFVELLQRHQRWNAATNVLNRCWIDSVREINQQSTQVLISCGRCGRALPGGTTYCAKCKSSEAAMCSFCRLRVRGLYVFCMSCGHGGHQFCIVNYFSSFSKCPSCSHLCEYQ